MSSSKKEGLHNEKNKKTDINWEEIGKTTFLNKIKIAIFSLEKFPQIAAEGFKKAIKYIIGLVAIFTFIVTLGTVFEIKTNIDNMREYVENNFETVEYNDGKLNIVSSTLDTNIISEIKNLQINLIVNTNEIDSIELQEYINDINSGYTDIVILNDKVLVSDGYNLENTLGYTQYMYEGYLSDMEITEFNKADVLNLLNSSQMIIGYIVLFTILFIYSLVIYLMLTLMNVLLISLIGRLASLFSNMKMRYVAIFNMAIYSITLSIVLNIIYVIINMFIDFKIEYFDTMYISVASIYMIASILILKTEFIKRQAELVKIFEEKDRLKKSENDKNKSEEEQEDNKKETKKDEKEQNENQNENENKEKNNDLENKLGENNA